jgi:cytochrome c oxidase subunit 2
MVAEENDVMKRTMILVLIMTTGLGALGYTTYSRPRADDVKVSRITAKKFDFTPNELTVKKGVPVVLELTSTDRVHGFSLPDFKLTAKIEPGKVTRVTFTPDRTGEFTFSCNIFCGSGHEDMAGRLIVTD